MRMLSVELVVCVEVLKVVFDVFDVLLKNVYLMM